MLATIVIALGLALPVTAQSVVPQAPCVVEVLVTAQRFDPSVPWKKSRPESRAGYAVVIGENRLVTTEDLIRNAVLVEVRRPGDAAKKTATVLAADPRINAALLSAPTPGLTAPEWAAPVKTGAKIQLVQFDDAGLRQNGEGRVTGIEVGPLPSAVQSVLTFQALTDLKLDRVGSPAFHEGKLMGLVMQYDAASQTSMVLPATILKRFVEDAGTDPYEGVAVAGLMWTPLIEPAKRQYFGLPADDRGVLVLRTLPGSSTARVLQPGDVILSWDGFPIDSQGYYNDPDYGRLILVHLIMGRRHPGETIAVTLWRNKKLEEVQLKLDAYDDSRALVPMNIKGEQAEYLVEGGMILRELSADYLLARGSQWMISSNPRLVNLYLTRAQAPEKPGDRVVLLSAVLPDPINVGYQDMRDEVILRVNGKPVSNIKDVFAIRDRDKGIIRFTTQTYGVDLVLDKATLAEANRRISTVYRIPKLEHRKALPALGPLRTLTDASGTR
jgi:S1-C subfamily serine protease